MPVLYRLICMVCGREGPGVKFKVHPMSRQSPECNAQASVDATIIITFDSQAHVIQVHKYCTKWETFRFALPAWNLFTQENDRA